MDHTAPMGTVSTASTAKTSPEAVSSTSPSKKAVLGLGELRAKRRHDLGHTPTDSPVSPIEPKTKYRKSRDWSSRREFTANLEERAVKINEKPKNPSSGKLPTVDSDSSSLSEAGTPLPVPGDEKTLPLHQLNQPYYTQGNQPAAVEEEPSTTEVESVNSDTNTSINANNSDAIHMLPTYGAHNLQQWSPENPIPRMRLVVTPSGTVFVEPLRLVGYKKNGKTMLRIFTPPHSGSTSSGQGMGQSDISYDSEPRLQG